MARKSKRPLLASFEDENRNKVKKSCASVSCGVGEVSSTSQPTSSKYQLPHESDVVEFGNKDGNSKCADHQEEGDHEYHFNDNRRTHEKKPHERGTHGRKVNMDSRLITDPNERKVLEDLVFGEGFTAEEDTDNEDYYNQRYGTRVSTEEKTAIIREKEENEDEEKIKVDEEDEFEDKKKILNPIYGLDGLDGFESGSNGDNESDSESRNSDGEDNCVWKDSDDEQIVVDLDSHTKLKKLKNEGKLLVRNGAIVSGKDYQAKLRKFHLKKREDAVENWVKAMKKRNAGDMESSSSDSDYDSVKKETEETGKRNIGASKFVSSSQPVLRTNSESDTSKIPYRMLVDANRTDPSNCPLQSCGFIPQTDNLLFTTGRDKTIRIFKVDGKENQRLSSIHLQNTPVRSAVAVPSLPGQSSPSIYFLTNYKTLSRLDIETEKISSWDIFGSKQTRKFHQLATACSLTHKPDSARGDFVVTTECGDILLCDVRSQSFVRAFKANTGRTVLAFDPKGEHRLFSGGIEGMIYVWDLRSSRCLERFRDEGSTHVTSLASGCSSQLAESPAYLAAGSRSGYVSIYDISGPATLSRDSNKTTSFLDDQSVVTGNTCYRDNNGDDLHFGNELFGSTLPEKVPIIQEMSEHRSPLKAFGNLTTPITSLAFHPEGSVLAMSTKWTAEGVKLARIPSFTVYSNFPNQNGSLKLKYPTSISFNDVGDLMAVGNDHGQVKLVQLQQFRSTGKRRTAY